MKSDHDVIQHASLAQQTDVLEGPGDAGSRHLVGVQPGDITVAEQYATSRRSDDAGDEVDDGRLAGTVRSNQAGDTAGDHVHRQLRYGFDAAEPLRQVLDRQHGHGARLVRVLYALTCSITESMMPFGR